MDIDWILFFSAASLAVVIEAIPYVLAPNRMLVLLSDLGRMNPASLQRYGLIMLGVGLLLLFIVRRVMIN